MYKGRVITERRGYPTRTAAQARVVKITNQYCNDNRSSWAVESASNIQQYNIPTAGAP